MKLIKLNCAACGAPISIPDNLEQLSCSNCGTHLMVEHGQGYYALKSAEQISDAINQSGRGTQDAIREGAQLTQKELKRLQLTQAYGNANTVLNATMAEQRTLARGQMTPATVKQLHVLNFQEWTQWEDVRRIQMQLDVLDGGPIETNTLGLTTQIDMLDHSILVMRSCPPSRENQKILQTLVDEKRLYQECLQKIKADELRGKIKSFTIKPPFSTDLNLLVKQLKQIQSDLSGLSRQALNPIIARLQQDLSKLNNQLYNHYHQEIYHQCWGETNPATDPGQDFDTITKHLKATNATARWLHAVPAPSRAVSKEIKQLQRNEKRLSKNHGQMQEQFRIRDALKLLRNGLAAFAITAPFNSNIQDVRGQMEVFQQDLRNLQNRPKTPEVRQAHQELSGHYREFYNHWAMLERQQLEGILKSGTVQPPFSMDLEQARADYALVTEDVRLLKEQANLPGAQELYQRAAAKQRQLYEHLLRLQQQAGSPPESP